MVGDRENSKILTGIYAGSFNPVHIGHLALANWLCEYTELDEVWFLVSPQNPFKEKSGLIDDQLRFEWVRKAVAGYPRFKASDIEFGMPQPSYTIDTLTLLSERYPDREFYLIIGADNVANFHKWKAADRLISDFHILVYPREGYSSVIPAAFQQSMKLVNAPLFEVSSSFIREACAEGRDVRFFLPESIREDFLSYIRS